MRPSKACPILRLVIPLTQRVVARRASIVSLTSPMDEFSMGTSPNGVDEDETEVKTSKNVYRVSCCCSKAENRVKELYGPTIRSQGTREQSPKKLLLACR